MSILLWVHPNYLKYHWIISVYSVVTLICVCVMHTSVTGRLWTNVQRGYLNIMSASGESVWHSTLRFKELLVYFTWTDKVKLKRWITVDTTSLLVTFLWGVCENVKSEGKPEPLCCALNALEYFFFFFGGGCRDFKSMWTTGKQLESKTQSAKYV